MLHITEYTQLTFIWLKSLIETIEKNVKNVNNVVLVFLLTTLNIFYTFFSAAIGNFEQVNARRANSSNRQKMKF